MRRLSLIVGVIFVLACLLLAAVQGWVEWSVLQRLPVEKIEQSGYFAIGWGTGVAGWLLSGHPATFCVLRKVPMASALWQKDALTSRLPIAKYLLAGLLFLGVGAAVGSYIWGMFRPAFDLGLLVGAMSGSVYSARRIYQSVENQVDFLEANQRYLNEEKVSLFSDDWT